MPGRNENSVGQLLFSEDPSTLVVLQTSVGGETREEGSVVKVGSNLLYGADEQRCIWGGDRDLELVAGLLLRR
jgi:hypothetical protein